MWSGKFCGCGKLSPVSFGVALGLTIFFAMFICDLWMMQYGIPPEKAKFIVAPITLGGAFIHALLGLFQGTIFGIFVAIFYDLLACCGVSGSRCGCGPKDGSCDIHK
jgi:hypothetical protein